jgi:4-amino-4-deoxy-L-arabinose transferase
MKRTLFILALIFLAVYILPLNLRPLVDPDETRYSEIPREMNESGDYVVPRLNGVLYFEKPVMGYWLSALSMKVFGETNFAGRLPQALAVGLSALFIFFLAIRFGGGLQVGTISALIYISCLEVFAVGVFNTLDSLLSFFLTACLASFFLAWDRRDNKKEYIAFLALSGLFCGLACHTKGFLAFAVPVSVIVPFVIWEGRWKEMFKIPWIPVAVAAIVMLPWGILIHQRQPDFWNYFFWHEHVQRFFSGSSQHKEPFYFFIPVLAGGMFPHIVLVPAAISGLIIKGFDTSFKRYLFCWFLFPFAFFSASSGKLETYILPCFAPLAMLLAIGILSGIEAEKKEIIKSAKEKLFTNGVRLLMTFPVLASIAVIALQHGVSHKMEYLFTDTYKIVLVLVSMVCFGALLIGALKAKTLFKRIMFFALSPLLFYASAHVLTPDKALLRNSPTIFIDENLNLFDKDTIVVSPSTPIKAVCWSLKRNDIFLLDEGGELSYGFGQNNMQHRQLTFESFGKMVAENKGLRKIVLILDERRFKRFKDKLPEPVDMKRNGKDGFLMAIY